MSKLHPNRQAMFDDDKSLYKGESENQNRVTFVSSDQDYYATLEEKTEKSKPFSHVCGLRRRNFFLVLAFAVLVVVGLAAGLGGGLAAAHSHRHVHSPSSTSSATPSGSTQSPTTSLVMTSDDAIGGSLNPSYYSKAGAWNGSDIDFSFSSLFTSAVYQHHSGEIRWDRFDDADVEGGSLSPQPGILDAKNSTPITLLTFDTADQNTSEWHIYYIDKTNQLREKWTNGSADDIQPWQIGSLDAANLSAFDADIVGMKIDTFDGPSGSGVRLLFPTDNQTFSLYECLTGEDTWHFRKSFTNVNGHAGIAWDHVQFNGSSDGNFHWTFLNNDGYIENWMSKDEQSHSWEKMTLYWDIDAPQFHPSTSFVWQDHFLFAQTKDHLITAYQTVYSSDNPTTMNITDSFAMVEYPATPGTRINAYTSGNETKLWFQTQGHGDGFNIISWDYGRERSDWTSQSANITDA